MKKRALITCLNDMRRVGRPYSISASIENYPIGHITMGAWRCRMNSIAAIQGRFTTALCCDVIFPEYQWHLHVLCIRWANWRHVVANIWPDESPANSREGTETSFEALIHSQWHATSYAWDQWNQGMLIAWADVSHILLMKQSNIVPWITQQIPLVWDKTKCFQWSVCLYDKVMELGLLGACIMSGINRGFQSIGSQWCNNDLCWLF